MIDPRTAGMLALTLLVALGAGDPAPKGYVCGRARAPIVVDGVLDDPAWLDAPWTDDFVDIEGDAKPRPRFRTRAKMAWDDAYFHVAAELVEPHVWATLTKHDSVIFHDNDFEVFIDPDGDNHAYYEVEINALATEWDLLLEKPYRDGGPAVDAWEIPGLKAATHVHGRINDPAGLDESWTVEFAFPWKALAGRANRPSPPAPGDQWRVNFSRVEWEHAVGAGRYVKVPNRPEANWVWSPQGAIDMHRPERWGYVQFADTARAPFRPDPTGPARDRLIAIYRAQADHQKRTKSWAPTLGALGLPDDPPPPGEGRPRLKPTPDGYEASIPLEAREGRPPRTVTIRQDSRLTVEP